MPVRWGLVRAALAACSALAVLGLPGVAFGAALPQQSGQVDLLNQANVQIQGKVASDHAGDSVAPAGDVNNDGIDDVIVGAPNVGAGAAYVVFGRPHGDSNPNAATAIDLNSLGSGGFAITGAANGDRAGASVDGVGDMNNDGKDDVIVGASGGNGAAYVVFGKATTSPVALGTLGGQGFAISGVAGIGADVAGAGDVDGNGTPDVILGAPTFDPSILKNNAGAAWVVFGRTTGNANLDLTQIGTVSVPGFRIEGAASGDSAGSSVDGLAGSGSAGNLACDTKADVIVGAPGAGNNLRGGSGSVFVVCGKGTTTTAVDLGTLNSSNADYRIDGAASSEAAGTSVAATGDVSGDAKPDIVIGTGAGKAYEVFGESSPPSTTRDLNSLNSSGNDPAGYLIGGAGSGTGQSVAGAGDLNSDGKPDVLVGAPTTDNNSRSDSGSAFLVFGKTASTGVNLANITTSGEGFLIDGAQAGDQLGFSVGAAGDFNGDGPADLISGANLATRNSRSASGAAYVVYGWETAPPDTQIDSGPPTPVASRSASFGFHGIDPSTPISFECSLDAPGAAHNQPFASCSSPKAYTSSDIVDDGPYTFSVRAIDRFGNVDGTAATRSWSVDTTGPNVDINSGPSGTVGTKSASFSFATNPSEPAFFLCSLDAPGTGHDQGESLCGSPKSYSAQNLPDDGQYAFKVRAIDSLGNLGPFATRTWTIDSTGPQISFDSGPPTYTNLRTASFTFHSNENAFLQCSLDAPGTQHDQPFGSCDSQTATTGTQAYDGSDLPANLDGRYTLSVRGIDAHLNVTSPAATRPWFIDTVAPTTTIVGAPRASTTDTDARLSFESEPLATFECNLDNGGWGSCLSPKDYANIAVGTHTFRARATDLAGNHEQAPYAGTRTWTVKASLPGACANTINGTAGDDTLQGSSLGEKITARSGGDLVTAEGGADCVSGGYGADEIEGNGGKDELLGDSGADLISGGAANDVVAGGAGGDTLMGDAGTDSYSGGAGSDTIYADDGRAERVNCGGGSDTVRADAADTLTACEHVTRARH